MGEYFTGIWFALGGTRILRPSGGIIAVLAGMSIIAGIAIAFIQRGPQVGLMFLVIAIVSVPAILIGGFKVLPHTPIGKLMIPSEVDSEEVLSDIATRRHLRDMIVGLDTRLRQCCLAVRLKSKDRVLML